MRALVWLGDDELRIEDLPTPQPDDETVVLEVDLAGICGSDLHPFRGHAGPRVPPLVLGHEVVGRVEGRLNTVYPLIGCGHCSHCAAGEENLCPEWRLVGMHRQGVFAEKIGLPPSALVAIPDEMDPVRAVLTEPLACAIGALEPYELGPDTRVAVLGCGPIGLLSIAVAAARGAEVAAVDPVPERRLIAERLGAANALESASGFQGSADVVVDAAGFSATWRTALTLVRSGGDVVVLGLGDAEGAFAMALLVRRAIRLRGQFAYSRAQFAGALQLLSEGLDIGLDSGWISISPLAEGPMAFAHLVSEPRRYIKVLLAARE